MVWFIVYYIVYAAFVYLWIPDGDLIQILIWHLRIGQKSPQKQQCIMGVKYSSDDK